MKQSGFRTVMGRHAFAIPAVRIGGPRRSRWAGRGPDGRSAWRWEGSGWAQSRGSPTCV